MDRNRCFLLLSVSWLIIFQVVVSAVLRRRAQLRRFQLMQHIEFYRRRRARRTILKVLLLLPKPRHRSIWKKKRSSEWWDKTVKTFDDDQWTENFRVRKGTFDFICNSVKDILAPLENAVVPMHGLEVDKIVAIALYKLAHVAEYKVIGNQFGVHKSTVHNCLYAFCLAITEVLGDEYIRMPDESEAQQIAINFEAKTNIPQIIGAIDDTHIPITAPEDGHADFVNRKLYCSIVLQAIVDNQLMFRDISCKLPGSCHDADVLRESNFYKNLDRMMHKGYKSVDGMDIPFMIIGDPAYPLQPWLMKNYNYDRNISPEMDSFNVYMNKGRIAVEHAFGRLKGRWRILLKRSEISYAFVPTLVAACCILHNICEMGRETFSNWWLHAVDDAEKEYPQEQAVPYDNDNLPDAVDIRDHLMLYLSRNFELLSSIRGRYAII